MRGIYKSIAIAVAGLSLLGAPAQAAVDATALSAAVSSGNAAGVQALINAAGGNAADLAVIAAALTTAPPGGTVNTTLLTNIAAANGGNGAFVTQLGTAMAVNLTPATVQLVLSVLVQSGNAGAANALGPVIVANGSASMQTAVANSGASTGTSGGGTTNAGGGAGGSSSGGTGKSGSENSGQTTDNSPSST
jgi:hypothetical protein